MSKSSALQDQINELDVRIQGAGNLSERNQLESERNELNNQLQVALAAESAQELTTQRIGYILDNMMVEGLTMAEIITNDDEYKLIRQGVQEAFVLQARVFEEEKFIEKSELTEKLNAMEYRAINAEQANEQLKKDSNAIETANFQLKQDNEALGEKVKKGAEQNHELTQQLEQKNQHIADLQNQIAIGVRGALNVVDIPQDTSKLAADIIARKIRITNVRFKDENGIDLRIKQAEVVLTGESIEYEAIYEKRYTILNAEQAEQYRADEANRKAELEAQNTSIPESIDHDTVEKLDEPELDRLNEENAEPGPINHNESQATDTETDSSVERDGTLDEMVEQTEQGSEVITLESLKSEVDKIKTYLGLAS